MRKLKNLVLSLALVSAVSFPTNIYAATVQEKIAGLYIAFFNRAADKSGIEYWEGQAADFGEDSAVKTLAEGFATHPKFTSLYSEMSNQEYVEAIYVNTLGQAGDSEGIAYWTALLDSGMSRSDMAAEFVSAALDFDKTAPQYASLLAEGTSQDASEVLDVAQERKDLLSNKVAVSLAFVNTLAEETNLAPSTDVMDPVALDADETYVASVNILSDITHDSATRESAKNLIGYLSSASSDVTAIINRLKQQFGSALQSQSKVDTIKSLVENLNQYSSDFETITSTTTGRTWMDRNLGASQACTSPDDEACYGDYYQWGRYPDGHEKAGSSTILRVSSSEYPDYSDFAISAYDWTEADDNGVIRSKTWNVCPTGFRIPSIDELLEEKISSTNNELKFPQAGSRNRLGRMEDKNEDGYLWSNTPVISNNSKLLKYSDNSSSYNLANRTTGASVRCLKVIEEISWKIGSWGSCSGTCGISNGEQIRSVTCQDGNGDVISDSYCSEPKPITSQSCATDACEEEFVSDTVSHNGFTYETVRSQYTGEVWLDRNLGADQVCTDRNDAACYGDYYQWGRNTDGHEKSDSLTTSTKAVDIDNAGDKFITNSSFDWASVDSDGALRSANWSKTDGGSVCPVDFRVPTSTELRAETVDVGVNNYYEAYDNFLKLPTAGYRYYSNGYWSTNLSIFWTSTISNYRGLYFSSIDYSSGDWSRGYGFSVRCISGNTPPVATNQDIIVNSNSSDNPITLSGSDAEGDALAYTLETNPLFGTLSGTPPNLTYTPTAGYVGSDSFTFTVNDGMYNSAVATVNITIAPVGIVHNGTTYDTVTSPYTGRIWLDRNLGASQVCTSLDDPSCYGDYYQWGRETDGHQLSASSTTVSQATDITNVGSDFFINYSEWTTADSNGALRAANWSKTDGTSVCPVDYRVPTMDELMAETTSQGMSNNTDAFDNFLKLPSAGYRHYLSASVNDKDSHGYIWSSSLLGSNSYYLYFHSNDALVNNSLHASGLSVRCLKEEETNIALHIPVTPLTNIVSGDPAYITNGYSGDVWYSYQGSLNTISFVIDLGSLYEINRIVFGPAQTRNYIIESSTDNINWTIQHNVTGLDYYNNTTQYITTSPTYNARYFRYTGTNSDGGYVGLTEFEVYGVSVLP